MSCTNKICWYRVFINGLIHVLYLVKPCENTLTKVSANLHCWEHSSAVSICKRDVNVIYDHDVGTCWNACNSGLGVLWTSCWMVLAAALKVGWPVFQTSLSTIWLRKCRRVSLTKGMQRSCWFGPELNPTNHGALHTPDCRSASIFKKNRNRTELSKARRIPSEKHCSLLKESLKLPCSEEEAPSVRWNVLKVTCFQKGRNLSWTICLVWTMPISATK